MEDAAKMSYKSFERLSKTRSLDQVNSQKSIERVSRESIQGKASQKSIQGEKSQKSTNEGESNKSVEKVSTETSSKKSLDKISSTSDSKKSGGQIDTPHTGKSSDTAITVEEVELGVQSEDQTSKVKSGDELPPIDIPEHDLVFLDGLPDVILVETVNAMDDELRHNKLENLVFEHFLEKNDPQALQAMNQVVETAIRMAKDSILTGERVHTGSLTEKGSRSSSVKQSFRGSIFTLAQEKGPRINLTQKTDLVLREMEETQNSFQSFVKRSHRQKCNLKAEIEEISIRKSEIKEARDIFEQVVVIEGVDPLTQRIPAEKFVRYMEEWLKSAQAVLEKIRLRVSTYKIQYKKVSNQLLQKQELGETLHAVDFEQLQIENKNFLETIDQKNANLLDLKRMNGTANLVLSTHKQYLQKQMEDLNNLKTIIKAKERKVDDLDRDSEAAEVELEAAREKYEDMKEMVTSYMVPDVMDYIKKKAELYELKKNLKVWSRRKHIQDIALKSCMREMKNLTGSTPTPDWFS